ncbi:hypothetical protein [Hymenobacter fodinae]|uniref:Uncharacterized protein n=1 Tax=Hymenobacter fodinae TaxID=2510796 RepID=A0A4Z0P6G8_9BACT|nr:hypothetical protein [Hymenobacter fodinae]TGE07729.1 hypothetical protein EU556_08220 [Hymenobacter fodinae]
MEEYSPTLQDWVAKQLAQADKPTFQKLLAYYRTRGGPGLQLAESEAVRRGIAYPQPFTLLPDEYRN